MSKLSNVERQLTHQRITQPKREESKRSINKKRVNAHLHQNKLKANQWRKLQEKHQAKVRRLMNHPLRKEGKEVSL